MATIRKTGKPRALQEAEDHELDDAPRGSAFDEDLNSFLHNTLGTSIVEAEVLSGQQAPPTTSSHKDPQQGTGLPSLQFLKDNFKTKSAAIRYMAVDLKIPVKIIAKHLSIKYQHARNVVKQELKRGPNEDFHLKDGQATSTFRQIQDKP